MPMVPIVNNSFFFYNVTATTEIYTLSLHDALPISLPSERVVQKRLTPRLPHVGRGIGRLRQTHWRDRKSTRLNSSHPSISYAVFCLKKKKRGRSPIRCLRTSISRSSSTSWHFSSVT